MLLKGVDKRVLRGMGHDLNPVVMIGKEGISEGLLAALDAAHATAELIKVKVLDTCPMDRRKVATELEEKTPSIVAQILGRMILLYRRDPDEPKISLPSYPLRENRP